MRNMPYSVLDSALLCGYNKIDANKDKPARDEDRRMDGVDRPMKWNGACNILRMKG
jgi:hypothetical protein